MAIERRPLREQIKDVLLERLGRGEYAPDQPINEVHLAADLGVSRTPLREALIGLEREGIIISERGKGFRFAPMSPQEFRDLTTIIATLESLALELSPPEYLKHIGPQLLEEAHAFSAPKAELGVIERYDDEWHDRLLSGCRNDRLMDLITTLKLTMHRYERVVVGDQQVLERSAVEHEKIAECLVAEDLPGAVAALKANWESGMHRILEKLGA
ncbi:transcriptional regulator, GntR family [Catenulispora acidiphila DSM 44928]|uniref:Transcriptional regulator, GntR family n=1 Tax=Catenulispora acidiphila (strain DSM 44928 / JCM 14897 / NBRC 102108 / NRRL B-24433 / ID139908) TaxID=479433 RepID=C7QFX9_CATAD|nr:GntR family transcriptional regulator [Catenulispora acidiphila]ACU70956.1 transcriptional regulator, GntR family [Catenulispora acidiphila DSM 44928]